MGRDHDGGGPDARHVASADRRLPRRRWLWLVALFALLVVWVALLTVDALRARRELAAASSLVATLQDRVLAGDRGAAAGTLEALQVHSETARDATRGVHWTAAAALPWVGPNVAAIREVADVVDGLATGALPALMEATQIIDPASFVPVDGRVDLTALQTAAPTVMAADGVVTDAVARLEALDTGELWSPVAGPLAGVRAEIGEVAVTTATAARAVQLLPVMLGADGPREYLLLVQGNAELRATGGVAESVILLQVDDGALEVLDSRSGRDLGDLPEPAVPATEPEVALFGASLSSDMRDVTLTPDFPRSAEIASAIWAQQVGEQVDGVVSVDPGTLALLLDDTGPVPLPSDPVADSVDGQLTSANAVAVLLSSVYVLAPDAATRDAFFVSATTASLSALLAGQGEPAAAIDALAEAARQGRLMVWSAHEDEQAMLAGTVLSGELRGAAGTSPVIGVFLDDTSRTKMGYYLQADVSVEQQECLADGSRTVGVAVILTNNVPPDLAALTPKVTGDGSVVPVGTVRTNVLLYAPTDGLIQDVQVAGQEAVATSETHDGLPVVGHLTELGPGQSVTIRAQVVTGSRFTGPLLLRSTPVAIGSASVADPLVCP